MKTTEIVYSKSENGKYNEFFQRNSFEQNGGRIGFSLTTSMGGDWQIKERFTLRIQSIFRHILGRGNHIGTNLYSLGLNTGFYYQLN